MTTNISDITVSVIIPAHNAAPWLPALFDGLDAQSFRDFETIFINDGSKDDTPALLDSYAAVRTDVQVLHKPNRGVTFARNAGLDAATGKYVAFIDADDTIAPSYLETLVTLAESLELDMAFCTGYRFEKRPGDISNAHLLHYPKPRGVTSGIQFLEKTVPDMEWFSGVWATLIRRGFIEENKFRFTEGLAASSDVLWSATIQPKAKRVAFAPGTSYYSRDTPGSIVNDTSTKGVQRRIRARTLVTEELLRMAGNESPPVSGLYRTIALETGRRLLGEASETGSLKQRIIISSNLRKRGFLRRLLHETRIKSHKKRILTAYFFSLLEIFTSRGYIAQTFRRLTLSKNQIRHITAQKRLVYLDLNIVDHCNLRCQGCDHFAPLASEYCVPLELIEQDLARLSKILKGDLLEMGIMGGEPLLHPRLKEIMSAARRSFPKTRINLRTNGILLLRQDEDLWKTCHEQNIAVIPTRYPINLDFDAMKETAAAYRVSFRFDRQTQSDVKTSYKIPLDIEGKQNPETNFRNCFHANTYPMLMEGRLYPCTVAPNVHHFNKSFSTCLELADGDALNIYRVMEASEIFDFLSTPKPFCRYCDVRNRSFGHKWERSKKAMAEWIA